MIVGFVILVVIIAGVIIVSGKIKVNRLPVPSPIPSIQQKIENKFPSLNIPKDSERAELKDVSGGNSMGLATRTEILADLPDLTAGQTYQVQLSNGSKNIIIGNLRQAKGGWILNYDSGKFSGYDKVTILRAGSKILEGSF